MTTTNCNQQEQTENDIEKWYVLSVSYRKEMAIQDELSAKGFETYIPLRYELRTRNGKKTRLQVPAISGLVFVRGSIKCLIEFRETCRLRDYVFLKKQVAKGKVSHYLFVRDRDMLNFKKVNEINGSKLTYFLPDELKLAKGSEVELMDGPFKGITGIVQQLPGKRGKYFVVSLPGVAIAAVKMEPKYVKPLTMKVEKSSNVERDTKDLIRMALNLLMSRNSERKSGKGLIACKIKQTMESLRPCKTYLPNDKARYHLAFYIAQLALNESTEIHRAELESVLPRLKPNNLFLPLSHLLFYYESQDEDYLNKANETMAKWNRANPTPPQKAIIEVRKFVTTIIQNDGQ